MGEDTPWIFIAVFICAVFYYFVGDEILHKVLMMYLIISFLKYVEGV